MGQIIVCTFGIFSQVLLTTIALWERKQNSHIFARIVELAITV